MRKNVKIIYKEIEDGYEMIITNTKNETYVGYISKMDYTEVSKYKWTVSVHNTDYRIIGSGIDNQNIYLHHFLLPLNDKKQVIDHIDRNPLNNRRENLRITTRSVNSTNACARNESQTKIRGVYFRKERLGIAKASWICEWSENKKRYSRSFSIAKYGEEEAFRLACSLREQKMKEMKI